VTDEGALLSDGRGPSQLDLVVAFPWSAVGGANDSVISALQYYLYKHNIARITAVGIHYCSFSISWTPNVPFGGIGSLISQSVHDQYEDLINTRLQYADMPVIILAHGYQSIHLQFNSTEYPDAGFCFAKQAMTRFAYRVPIWVTLNELNITSTTTPTITTPS